MTTSSYRTTNEHVPLTLRLNGRETRLHVPPRRTLQELLRDDLGLTGTKSGCEMGNCGACTVHLGGRAVYSCLVLAAQCRHESVTTIEGIAHGTELSAVQRAFIESDALQCGYCTPGQIMSLEALLDSVPDPDEAQIVAALAGNLCRCGAYRHILAAARRAVELRRTQAPAPGGLHRAG